MGVIGRDAMRRVHRIILVEDNPAICKLTTFLLRGVGHRVITARTGEDGVAIILHDHADLVLLDLRLPGIDGYEVLHQVRSNPDAKNTTVVAFTAIMMSGESARLVDAGFDACIDKPIDPRRFLRDVAAILGSSPLAAHA